ncbi:MAG: ATP-binding protein [Pseudomonadota bacterium]
MNLPSRKALVFTASVTSVCVALVGIITTVLYTFIIPRDVLFELMVSIPVTLLVAVPVTFYIGLMQDRLHALNENLESANEEAKQADRAKSEFLANMSHEIRTPMNGVMGMAELLVKTELTEKQKGFAEIILRSGNSLLTIINDILDFSKIDAGQMELDPAPFNLRPAIDDVATLVSSKAAEKDLELIVRISPDLPDCFVGDVGRLRQVLINVIGNAIKFTELGHVILDVDGSVSGEHASLSFTVEDTGIGIPEEKLDLIFKKFSQADESATRKHQGTGLGLAISASLVSLMGGEIAVSSKPGAGSKFSFAVSFPIAEQQSEPMEIPNDVTSSRILVVDDNSVNRSILLENLTSWKFEAASVESGAEALAFLDKAAEHGLKIDCVILDYHMPGMTGSEVAEAMRNKASTSKLPIIMLTSVDHMDNGKTFSSLGIDGHLVKPASASALLETIIRVLACRAGANREITEQVANAAKIAGMKVDENEKRFAAA